MEFEVLKRVGTVILLMVILNDRLVGSPIRLNHGLVEVLFEV